MIRVTVSDKNRLPAQANLALFVYEKSSDIPNPLIKGAVLKKWLREAEEDGFTGKANQVSVVHPRQKNLRRLFFIGLGPKKDTKIENIRRAIGAAVRAAEKLKLSDLCVACPTHEGQTLRTLAQAATEGVMLGGYKYLNYKTKENKVHLKSVTLFNPDPKEKSEFVKGTKLGTIFSRATIFARDLINLNPSDTTPEEMVKVAKGLAHGPITIKVFDKDQIAKMGMGGLLGVNRGSAHPPMFVHLTYKSEGPIKKKIGIVGKGITFDSGGLSLKPSSAMEDMKMDMSGAAAVYGVFQALADLKPQGLEIHGITPLTENMPGGDAMKPGDVVKTYGGKTIEVLNTDAEGRLILADALGYASDQKLDEIIDMATLTGACIVALGPFIAGMMGTDRTLIENLKLAADAAGEKLWELPLEKEYMSHMDSQFADLKNIGKSGKGGTIIGGLFLKEFVEHNIPWVHLDIAGPAWADEPVPLSAFGGTGFMVRTILQYMLSSQ